VVVAVVVGGVAAVAGSWRDPDSPAVVVADERGRELASVPRPPSGRFALQYRHVVHGTR
jgi:hypothetical protein